MKKKLLFVGPYPPPYGGIASHLYDLLPQLVNHGYEVVSLTTSQNERVIQNHGEKNIFFSPTKFFYKNIHSVVAHFVQCLKYKHNVKMKDFIKIVNMACLTNKIIKEEEITATFIYNNYNGMTIPILRKYFNIRHPLAFMIFGDFYLRPDTYKYIPEYIKDMFNECDVILSSSQYCADSISNVLGYDFPVKVIYIGVDHNSYVPTCCGNTIRSELNIPSTATVFLFMARMVKDMGLDFILENASMLLNLDKEVYLIIAGAQGSLSQQAKRFADSNSRVRYCPNISFDKKIEYYAASDIVIAPTMERHACMGVSIKEAMSCAKPVIASTSGGIQEAIDDGINGFLIPIVKGKLDKKIFFDRAKQLLNNPLLRKTMGAQNREKVLRMFTNDQTTQKYLDVLNIILRKTNYRQ